MKNIHNHPPTALSNSIGNIFKTAFECTTEEVINHCEESFLGYYPSKELFAQELWNELKEESMIEDLDQSIEDYTNDIFPLLFKYENGYVFCDNW